MSTCFKTNFMNIEIEFFVLSSRHQKCLDKSLLGKEYPKKYNKNVIVFIAHVCRRPKLILGD